MKPLDKTNYKNYLICPCYGWHKFHNKNVDEEGTIDQYIEVGQNLEKKAQLLFPDGIEIGRGTAEQTAIQTAAIIKDNKFKDTIYQATALSNDELLAKADIVNIHRANKTIDIYEVKASTSLKLKADFKDLTKYLNEIFDNEYLQDVTFQKIAFENSGYKVSKVYLIYPNKEYRLYDKLDIEQLFNKTDVSLEVDLLISRVKEKITQVQQCYGNQDVIPECMCRYKSQNKRCLGFKTFNKDIPIYNSVLNINGIRANKIKKLLDEDIKKIIDIDLNKIKKYNFNQTQINQITALKTNQLLIDQTLIDQLLSPLEFPLYFLDYEAFGEAIPIFQNSAPYKQIPFQYSLHILRTPQTDPQHFEYLLNEATTENLIDMVEALKKQIGKKGSVIAWHYSAEKTFQKNLVELLPQYAPFFKNIEKRFFDLKTIFSKQAYIDPKFEGQAGLKKIAEVLTPEHNYKQINIQEGQQASHQWHLALNEKPDHKDKIFNDLLEYCKYDTLTMVDIYKFLNKLITT